LPGRELPLSHRDAQLVIAREYGFAGWTDLVAEVERRLGRGLSWAGAQARAAIQDRDDSRLRELLAEYPALVSWRGEDGSTLVNACGSYAMDCSDPERERTFNRPEALEMLIDAGAVVPPSAWEHVINTGASGMLRLLSRKNVLPATLPVFAALGDVAAAAARISESSDVVRRALMYACRFRHSDVALSLLERLVSLDPELERRIDRWQGGQAFVEFWISHPGSLWDESLFEKTLWESFVVLQLQTALRENDLAVFRRWLSDEPWVVSESFVPVQVDLIEQASLQKGRDSFLTALLEGDPAVLRLPVAPPARALEFALSYGNSHLVPMLTRIWPLPEDLPHAAGVGDLAAVSRWFDSSGRPALGDLSLHYPSSDPKRVDLGWVGPVTVQQILDVALAWAVVNRHFSVASFLLSHGADVNSNWCTHEPASILHECAINGNFEGAQFLIDHGADLTMLDHRWRSTAEGWARYGAGDARMAELLAAAAAARRSLGGGIK
jgi:hypothetical protein